MLVFVINNLPLVVFSSEGAVPFVVCAAPSELRILKCYDVTSALQPIQTESPVDGLAYPRCIFNQPPISAVLMFFLASVFVCNRIP